MKLPANCRWSRAVIRAAAFAALISSVALPESASADTFFWDADADAGNGVTGGSGIWDTVAANWFRSGTDVPWPNTFDDAAIFGGVAGVVTIQSAGVNANALTFNSSGYVVDGGLLNLGTTASTTTTPAINVFSGVAVVAAPVAGTAGLLKSGSGNVSLTSPNTYTGGTTVAAGTLRVDNDVNQPGSATGGGAVTVNDGAGIGGVGRIAGALTVNGDIAPGASIGTLTTAALTLNSTATFALELSYSGAANTITSDLIIAGGNVTLNGAMLSIANIGSEAVPIGTVFTIISTAPGFQQLGIFGNTTFTDGTTVYEALYRQGDINDLNNLNDVRLVAVGVVPEPETWALLVGGFTVFAVARVSRRRRAGRLLGDRAAATRASG